MCERINAINRYYKILVYDDNKQEALNKISTLHKNLKFQDNNNFSDRFFQTASVIEKNLSVFKSACNHVDIVTTLLDHLYSVGIKAMFDKTLSSVDDFNIIYLMFIICEESEIPLFLKRAIIYNSTLIHIDGLFEPLISNYTMEMIVFEDSDLYAIITYLKIKSFLLLQVKKIFIQESIKQKFLWLLKENCKYYLADLPFFIFHSRNELFTYCKDSLFHFNMTSIWSEDITSAKTLAIKLQRDVIFINAYLEFGAGIMLPFKEDQSFHYELQVVQSNEDGDKINLNICTGSVYNHFYNGTWQQPVNDTYWIYNDNICARGTREDINKCRDSAMEAFESWSTLPITFRKEILNNLAYTLECNGKYLLAKTVLKCVKLSDKLLKNTIISQDERLELICVRAPRGVIPLYPHNEVTLFSYLTAALVYGNCVVILCGENLCNIAPYCNMFSTSEIPPGVINLISDRDIRYRIDTSNTPLFNKFMNVTVPKNIILPLK